jgi:deoxycytidine triphosphate deaminase
MVWSDREIRQWAKDGGVGGELDLAQINPGSVDLTLGSLMRRPMWWWRYPISRWIACLFEKHSKSGIRKWGDEEGFSEYWLMPGEFILCASREFTFIPTDAIGLLFSKSSTGRTGLEHLHAGYGDQGFGGQWTWELSNMAPWPIKLVAGKRLMQLVLMTAHVPDKDYSKTGRYQGQVGPTPPR